MDWLSRARQSRPTSPPVSQHVQLEVMRLEDRTTPVVITNGIPAGTPGQFGGDIINAGDIERSILTVIGASGATITNPPGNFIADYTNFIATSSTVDTLSTSTVVAASLIAPNTVQSSGTFMGDNGEVNWTATSTLGQRSRLIQTTITFNSVTPFGNLRLINYLDEDVLGVSDDVLLVRQTLATTSLPTIDSTELIGFAQFGPNVVGSISLQGASFEGFAADRFPVLRNAIQNGTATFSPTGVINLPQTTIPGIGTVFGPADVTSALSYILDPNATSATIRIGLGFVPASGEILTPTGVIGADAGGGPRVQVFDPITNQTLADFFAYDPIFKGGVRVATGDVNGDSVEDIITGAGPGGGAHIKVFDGGTFQEVGSFIAINPFYTGGVFVASGDLNGDGFAEIIVSAGGPGAGPVVEIYDGVTGLRVNSFFAYNPLMTAGINIAVADVNGDGFADIITAPGAGVPSVIQVFDGRLAYFSQPASQSIIASFFGYDPSKTGGAYVAAGDLDFDGFAEIVIGPGPLAFGQPVRVFQGRTLQPVAEYLPYADQGLQSMNALFSRYDYDLRVAVVPFVRPGNPFGQQNGILVSPGPGRRTLVRVIDPDTGLPVTGLDRFPFGPNYFLGAFVG